MIVYFEKNETEECKCFEPKKTTEIFCPWCENFWASTVAPFVFINANASVDKMNAKLSEMHGM